MPRLSLDKLDVLLLAGGLGKRLRKVVDDKPKPMADTELLKTFSQLKV